MSIAKISRQAASFAILERCFSDPLKLVPFVLYAGVFILLGVGRITVNEAILLLGAAGLAHAGISSVNNVNPK